jgi:hypothetical protein
MEITVRIRTPDRPACLGNCLDELRHQTVGADRTDILAVASAHPGS